MGAEVHQTKTQQGKDIVKIARYMEGGENVMVCKCGHLVTDHFLVYDNDCRESMRFPCKKCDCKDFAQKGDEVPMEFKRCPIHFVIRSVHFNMYFKCDLKEGHSGQCMSLPDGEKVATVMWPKEKGF